MARPSLIAGVTLAMMEALADFGTVATFGYRTLTEAVYRVWYGMFDRAAATQVASVLLLMALALLTLERASRGRARFAHGERRARRRARASDGVAGRRGQRQLPRRARRRVPPAGEPAGLVVHRRRAHGLGDGEAARPAGEHLALAGTAPPPPVCSRRPRVRRPAPRRLRSCVRDRLAGIGYALPGSVFAVGALVPFEPRPRPRPSSARLAGGAPAPGLLMVGSAARARSRLRGPIPRRQVADGGGESGQGSGRPRDAARVLGAGAGEALAGVHLPSCGGALTALVLSFVESMEEMPAPCCSARSASTRSPSRSGSGPRSPCGRRPRLPRSGWWRRTLAGRPRHPVERPTPPPPPVRRPMRPALQEPRPTGGPTASMLGVRMTAEANVTTRVETLREEIRRHDHLYYVESRPEISDAEYDRQRREFAEARRPVRELITPDGRPSRSAASASTAYRAGGAAAAMLSLGGAGPSTGCGVPGSGGPSPPRDGRRLVAEPRSMASARPPVRARARERSDPRRRGRGRGDLAQPPHDQSVPAALHGPLRKARHGRGRGEVCMPRRPSPAQRRPGGGRRIHLRQPAQRSSGAIRQRTRP